jgi:hypothetical protein
MKLSDRMAELQAAMNQYGDTTVRNYFLIHKLGDAILHSLKDFLGDGAAVLGVRPDGEWKAVDYRGGKFSTHYSEIIQVEPIQMGVAICIPHSKDDGEYWIRVVVDFDVEGDEVAIRIGDREPDVRVSIAYDDSDMQRIHVALFQYCKSLFENPVRFATATGSGKFGFIGLGVQKPAGD